MDRDVGEVMTRNDDPADAWLETALASDWHAASERAHLLCAQIEYLTWPDRSKALDRFFWTEANDRLGPAEITAVINRQVLGTVGAQAVGAYAHHVKSVLTAA